MDEQLGARGIHLGGTANRTSSIDFKNSRAYLIGIDQYDNGIRKLKSAVADATRVAELLQEHHGYQKRLITLMPRDKTPTRDNLRSLFQEEMPNEVEQDDRVFVYFAGHGFARDGEDGPAGYLVPQDASLDVDSMLPISGSPSP